MTLRSKVWVTVTLSLFILLDLPSSQSAPNESEPLQTGQRRTSSDPVSNFFSEFGDLILDVDRAVAVHSQPKVERESYIVSQLFRPRTDYFDRIQKNYNDIQKRLGKFIGDTIGFKNTYSDHELSTINPPLENFVPTIKPDYNPFTAAAEARKAKLKRRLSEVPSENQSKGPVELFFGPKESIPEAIPEALRTLGELSKAIIDDIGDVSKESASESHDKENAFYTEKVGSLPIKCSNEVLRDPVLELRRQEKCSRIAAEERARSNLRLMSETKRANEILLSESLKTLEQFSEGIGRSGDSLENLASFKKDSKETGLDSDASRDECLGEVLEDSMLENIRKEKCARNAAEDRLLKDLNKLLLYSKITSESLFPVDSKETSLSSTLTKRNGEAEGDMSYSGSFFDKRIRQLIKDHGSWVLDYPLIKRWRQKDELPEDDVSTTDLNLDEMYSTTVGSTSDGSEIEQTEVYVPVSSDYEASLRKSGETISESPLDSSYYRIVNDDGGDMEEVDIILDPESLENDIQSFQIERQEPKETIILAFTSDGVPLKIRLGPEVDNPLQYLHKALQSAGVSLNIPVESYDNLEPVGKEVLKLGSGILTRAVVINASDSNEFKSLLKALMVSKSSGKTTL